MCGIIIIALCVCVSPFVNEHLGQAFNHRAKFHIDRWWDGEPAHPSENIFMRLSNRVFEREVNRQRYNDAAKDADWKEALIIHTLISLCLRSRWTPYIFSEDYLPVLTTLEMLKVSSSRRPSSWSSSFYTKKWAHRLETASDVFTTQTDNESTSVAYSSICTFFY